MAEITIPIVGLGVDGALLFSQRGKGDVKQIGAEVPINLKYTIGLGSLLGVYFAAGPDFFFDFDKKDNVDRKKTQVGLNLGVGVKLIKHLQVGVKAITHRELIVYTHLQVLDQLHTDSQIKSYLSFLPINVVFLIKIKEKIRTGSKINTQQTTQANRIFQIDGNFRSDLLYITLTSLRE